MAEVQVKLRYNPDSEVVELVVGDEVVGDSGADEFESWVNAYVEAHPDKWVAPTPEPTEEERLRQRVADLEAELEVANAANAPEEDPVTEENPAPVDNDSEA